MVFLNFEVDIQGVNREACMVEKHLWSSPGAYHLSKEGEKVDNGYTIPGTHIVEYNYTCNSGSNCGFESSFEFVVGERTPDDVFHDYESMMAGATLLGLNSAADNLDFFLTNTDSNSVKSYTYDWVSKYQQMLFYAAYNISEM